MAILPVAAEIALYSPVYLFYLRYLIIVRSSVQVSPPLPFRNGLLVSRSFLFEFDPVTARVNSPGRLLGKGLEPPDQLSEHPERRLYGLWAGKIDTCAFKHV